MKSSKNLSLLAFLGTLGFLVGCISETESHLITTPPPPDRDTDPAVQEIVVVTEAQQIAAAAVAAPTNSYIVIQKPPAPHTPVDITDRPTSAHIWVAGHWIWQNTRYAWMAGQWVVPPYAGAKWVKPRTVSEDGAFRFYEGHWN